MHAPCTSFFPKPPVLPKTTFPSQNKTRLRFPVSAAATAKATTTATATSLYDVLSVTETAGQEEIKAAYRKEAMRWHPDTCGSEKKGHYTQQFIKVREAYRVLSDPVLREEHDGRLRNGFDGFFMRNNRERNCDSRNWETQLGDLDKKSAARRSATSSSWGSRVRASRNTGT